MFNLIIRFFDRLEDRVRMRLSHRSILYAFIGGAAHVLFWRGVWHTADLIMHGQGWLVDLEGNPVNTFWGYVFYEPITIIWTSVIMLMTGLFVATFIGERIIISGLKGEKKVTDRTEEEVKKEESQVKVLNNKINTVITELDEIKNEVSK